MTKMKIYEIPEPVLRQKAEKVVIVDQAIRQTLSDMLETMYAGNGVGLAANQVGLLKRLVVIGLEFKIFILSLKTFLLIKLFSFNPSLFKYIYLNNVKKIKII